MTNSEITFPVQATVVGLSRYDFTADGGDRILGGRISTLVSSDSDDAIGFSITTISCDYGVFTEAQDNISSFPCDVVLTCVLQTKLDKNKRSIQAVHCVGIGSASDSFTNKKESTRASKAATTA